MKRKMRALLLFTVMVLVMMSPVFGEGHITVKIDGAVLDFPDARPFIEDGRTLVPIRAIAEALGSEVAWDPDTRIAEFQKGSDIILLQIGSRSVTINDKRHTIDVPAKISEERTYVPLRFVSEALGANVEWVGETRTVLITTDGSVAVTPPPAGEIPMIGSVINYQHYTDRIVPYPQSGLNLEKHSAYVQFAKDLKEIKVAFADELPFALGRTGHHSRGATFEIQGLHNDVMLVKDGATVTYLQYMRRESTTFYNVKTGDENLLWDSQYLMWESTISNVHGTFYIFPNPYYKNPF